MNPQDVRRRWAERSGAYSPEYYAYHGPDDRSERVRELLVESVGRDARVLEVGCSSGRHLAHLHDDGFRRLHGVEVNPEAVSVMREHYPDLAADTTVHVGRVEAVAGVLGDDAFDAVYSVESLQHVHPDSEEVFDDLVRVADERLITVENEQPRGTVDAQDADGAVTYVEDDVPLYHRDWSRVFAGRGVEELATRDGDRTTTRVFRPVGG